MDEKHDSQSLFIKAFYIGQENLKKLRESLKQNNSFIQEAKHFLTSDKDMGSEAVSPQNHTPSSPSA